MSRDRHSFRSRDSVREVKPRLLVICEGVTEENYFKLLGSIFRRDISFEIYCPSVEYTDPVGLVREAARLMEIAKSENNAYEHCFVIADTERTSLRLKSIQSARCIVNNHEKLELIISNPSFEVVILMHFEYTTRLFTNVKEAVKAVKKFIPDYKKAYNFKRAAKILEESVLLGYYENANTHCEKLKNYNNEALPEKCATATDVYRFFKLIELPKLISRMRS